MRHVTISYSDARRQNALLKDHQLEEKLSPLMMENGGVSSLFPKTLGDLFGTSGKFDLSLLPYQYVCLIVRLQQGRMLCSLQKTTICHLVRSGESLGVEEEITDSNTILSYSVVDLLRYTYSLTQAAVIVSR